MFFLYFNTLSWLIVIGLLFSCVQWETAWGEEFSGQLSIKPDLPQPTPPWSGSSSTPILIFTHILYTSCYVLVCELALFTFCELYVVTVCTILEIIQSVRNFQWECALFLVLFCCLQLLLLILIILKLGLTSNLDCVKDTFCTCEYAIYLFKLSTTSFTLFSTKRRENVTHDQCYGVGSLFGRLRVLENPPQLELSIKNVFRRLASKA